MFGYAFRTFWTLPLLVYKTHWWKDCVQGHLCVKYEYISNSSCLAGAWNKCRILKEIAKCTLSSSVCWLTADSLICVKEDADALLTVLLVPTLFRRHCTNIFWLVEWSQFQTRFYRMHWRLELRIIFVISTFLYTCFLKAPRGYLFCEYVSCCSKD